MAASPPGTGPLTGESPVDFLGHHVGSLGGCAGVPDVWYPFTATETPPGWVAAGPQIGSSDLADHRGQLRLLSPTLTCLPLRGLAQPGPPLDLTPICGAERLRASPKRQHPTTNLLGDLLNQRKERCSVGREVLQSNSHRQNTLIGRDHWCGSREPPSRVRWDNFTSPKSPRPQQLLPQGLPPDDLHHWNVS